MTQLLNNTKKSKHTGRGKKKGNKYERQVARNLSTWMFSSPTILYKHEDSGARKIVYTGDIIPKDADNFHWTIWPFAVEVKNGYEKHIPTLMTQTLLRKWIVKLLSERTNSQRIPLLICQFHHQIPILLTTIDLKAHCDISLAQEYNGEYEMFYIYKYNQLLKLNFFDIMPDWFQDVVFSRKPIVTELEIQPNKIINDQAVVYNSNTKLPKKKSKKTKDEEIGEIIDQLFIT